MKKLRVLIIEKKVFKENMDYLKKTRDGRGRKKVYLER